MFTGIKVASHNHVSITRETNLCVQMPPTKKSYELYFNPIYLDKPKKYLKTTMIKTNKIYYL